MVRFSIIIPVRKIPIPLIASTLESVALQKDIEHEVLLVENHNCLQIQEVINRFEAEHIKSVEADSLRVDALVQAGIEQATGEYINILRPGEYYISNYALQIVSEFIDANDGPDVVACGRIVRKDNRQELKFDQFDQCALKCGCYPTTFEHLWMKSSIFESTGPFDADFQFKGKFDFFCRLANTPARIASFHRVLTDSHRLKTELKSPLLEGQEMIQILSKRFGPWCAIRWWFTQNQVNFFQGLFKVLKKSFLGRT